MTSGYREYIAKFLRASEMCSDVQKYDESNKRVCGWHKHCCNICPIKILSAWVLIIRDLIFEINREEHYSEGCYHENEVREDVC